MARTKLNKEDKAYVRSNYQTMKVSEMCKAIGVYDNTIYQFMKKNSLATLGKKVRAAKVLPVQPHQEAWIKNNHANYTVSEMAREINNTNYAVVKILAAHGLDAKKIYQVDKPQLKTEYNVVNQKFERPAAEYSNKQWNE